MAHGAYIGAGAAARKAKRMYLGDGESRKVKKGYIGQESTSRLCYSGETEVSYTGRFTVQDIEFQGKTHRLWTLTSSGTLKLDGDPVRVWLCGGGANGTENGGGGGYVQSGEIGTGNYTVTIGSRASKTTVGTYTANGASNINGGSGGGHNGYSGGKGAGISTIPFGISTLGRHCAGGGAGADVIGYTSSSVTGYGGGNGGSNGGDGSNTSGRYTVTSSVPGGNGGDKGGGSGGYAVGSSYFDYRIGGSASFYGSGGGGGATYDGNIKTPGSGYQGVAYLLVSA